MDIQINQNFVCILNGLLVAPGANMSGKASQKGGQGGDDFPPVLGLGGVLGALGNCWAPRFSKNLFLDPRCGGLLAQPWINLQVCTFNRMDPLLDYVP